MRTQITWSANACRMSSAQGATGASEHVMKASSPRGRRRVSCSRSVAPALRTPGCGLLLDLEIDAAAAEDDLDALGGRDQIDRHARLVAHGRYGTGARRRRARCHTRVVAVEVADALQVVHLARGLDLSNADVADGEALHVDRGVLALVRHLA